MTNKATLGFAEKHTPGQSNRAQETDTGEYLIDLTEILRFKKRNRDLARTALSALSYIPSEVRDTLQGLRH